MKVATIDQYIEAFPSEVQTILQNIRKVIREGVPGVEEGISYNMPTFKHNGYLAYIAAYKMHIGLYPATTGNKVIDEKSASYKHPKDTLRFPLKQPIPYELIREIVEYRAKVNSQNL